MAGKVLVSWSSGKDSAWMVEMLRHDSERQVVGLMTTIGDAGHRVAMHGVHRDLVQRQAESLGLPIRFIPLPEPCSNQDYEAIMQGVVASALAEGIGEVAFGDLYLDDVRAYRESRLAGTGLAPVFPLWEVPTVPLVHRMIHQGLRAVITCVDSRQLDPRFVGRTFDEAFLADLPDGVDPCGERGEFHTFVFDAPSFAYPIAYTPGNTSERDGFVYLDLLPAQ